MRINKINILFLLILTLSSFSLGCSCLERNVSYDTISPGIVERSVWYDPNNITVDTISIQEMVDKLNAQIENTTQAFIAVIDSVEILTDLGFGLNENIRIKVMIPIKGTYIENQEIWIERRLPIMSSCDYSYKAFQDRPFLSTSEKFDSVQDLSIQQGVCGPDLGAFYSKGTVTSSEFSPLEVSLPEVISGTPVFLKPQNFNKGKGIYFTISDQKLFLVKNGNRYLVNGSNIKPIPHIP